MSRPQTASSGFLISLAVLLALAHALMAVSATATKSATADEIAHVVAGHAYNTRSDYRFQPENGNLPQRWAALPLLLASAPLPNEPELWRRADIWRYSHAFFYEQGLSTDAMLMAGRAMISLFSAGLGLLIFFWSRALFGWRGAFLSLALYAFCPAFLAHGALATSDVVMTFFFLASAGAYWRHLDRPGPGWAALSSLVFGLACVAKFSAVLLVPVLGLCALGWAARQREVDRGRRALSRLVRSAALHVATAWAVIWIFYGFRFQAFASGHEIGATFYRGDWAWILWDIGWSRRLFEIARDGHLLPEGFLYGFAFVLQFARERAAFLNGEYSTTGWAIFFPFAFAVKTTLPLLLLLAAGAVVACITARRYWFVNGLRSTVTRLRPLTPLAALFLVYWATSITSHLNIGHRHILPTYPVLFIAVGWLGQWVTWRRPVALLGIVGGLLWHAGESLVARPNYLTYFNQIIGGSSNGWRHLVDSSLDWGQDLPGLKRWLDANARNDIVYLSYFGTGDPAYEGIRAIKLPTLPEDGSPRAWHRLTSGVYAIGATMLQHVYSSVRGNWTVEFEREFQTLRALEPSMLAFHIGSNQRADSQPDPSADKWGALWKRYEQLRFARLCHYLRVREADATIGHSIRVYRLNAAELNGAVAGTAEQWRSQIERAVSRRQQDAPIR